MNWSIEQSIIKRYKKISTAEWIAFISAMISGFIVHGFMFYNKISYLDDNTYYFGLGATYSSGRWGLGIIKEVQEWLGLQNYSMPVFNGFFSILWISVMAALIVRMLDMQNKICAALAGAYMVVFPTVASTFAYMFTAPYYFFSALLMVIAVYCVRKSKYGMVPAILAFSFGMGIYQANIGVASTIFVLILICDAKKKDFLENISVAIRCFISLVLGIILYFIFNHTFLNITQTELGDYQGISGMADMTLDNFLSGVFKGYKTWWHLTRWEIVGISNSELIRNLYAICLLLFLVTGVVYLYCVYRKKGIWNTLYTAVLFILVPLSLGVIFVMTASPNAYVHTLMIYNLVFIPIYPLAILQNLKSNNLQRFGKALLNWLQNISVITIFVMFIFYFRLDNMAYLKANYQQECAASYYTVLISQIKSTENYSDKLPVLFLGSVDGQDLTIHSPVEFEKIKIQGYHTNMNNFIAYFAKAEFLQLHCGYEYYTPSEADVLKIHTSEYVQKMPCYPKDGSIQVVDGIVVVKFSDKY